MGKKVAINNICRATGIATQIGAFVAILKFKKPRLGLAMGARCSRQERPHHPARAWHCQQHDRRDESPVPCRYARQEGGCLIPNNKKSKGEYLICLRNLHGCR